MANKHHEFRLPFEGQLRQSFIHDRFLRVPKIIEKSFEFPGWQHPDLFGNTNAVQIEYCSGNGGWIAAKAEANPTFNWVAIEMKAGRSRKIWTKIKNRQLLNLVVVNGEGHKATEELFPSDTIDSIYINFPDPWPKRRHFKNRIIQPKFVAEMARILRPHGTIIFVTDDEDYSAWTIDIFQNSNQFSSHYPAPFYACEWQDYGSSFFDELWRQKGKSIRYHQFKRI